MQFLNIGFITFLAAAVAAADIDDNDIPIQCRSVCQQ